jgi:uncharacterized protein (TIRG00374 family)
MPHSGKIIGSLAVSVAAYLLWAIAVDGGEVWASVLQLGWGGLSLVVTLSLVNYALRFARWQSYLSMMGHSVPLGASARCYVAGFALTTTPGKAGEAIRSVFLRRYGVPVSGSLAALFAERFADILSMTLIALVGLAAFPQLRWVPAVALALVVPVWLLVGRRRFRNSFASWTGRIFDQRFRRLGERVAGLLDDAARLIGPRALFGGVVVGLVAWGAEALAFAFIVHAIGYPLSVPVLASIYALAMLAGALSFMPGGLGGAEAAMGVMLLALGLPAADVVSATLICRVTTLWLAVLLGVFALGGSSIDRPGVATT